MSQLERIIEAALFAAPKPLTIKALLKLFPEDACPEAGEIEAALQSIESDYAERGINLKQVSSGYRFQVSADVAPELRVLFEEKPARYSRALLETLALIAYRQPITRAEVEEVRGVVVSTNIVKTLLEHEWIRIVGHKDVPGKPALFATTKQFLDHFNLKSLDELPPLSQIVDLDKITSSVEEKTVSTDDAVESQVEDEVETDVDVETEASEAELEENSTLLDESEEVSDTSEERFADFSEVVISNREPSEDVESNS
ncbi:MAG: SMC-Scp complex subunit ScpB [Legionellales bacterium]|nr:SMC-Scp complex subunit ScpB [Legionellales bacterium]|tara:strand:- start:3266 stop:4036 length:771 start_codon:yes stop_codon:yes gene_type:complete